MKEFNRFNGIVSYDTNKFMLIWDNLTKSYKLYKKYEDRRYTEGYKFLLIGQTTEKEIINALIKNHLKYD